MKNLLWFFFGYLRKKNKEELNADIVIFGLGNPGHEYVRNRHNIGFRVVEEFIKNLKGTRNVVTDSYDLSIGTSSDKKVVAVIKPLTFMNRSGEVVSSLLKRNVTADAKILVVVDDFNIPLGTMRARKGGSHGGHNGLKSIISFIGSEFSRLRIGIGPLPEKSSVIDFVLGNFTNEEEQKLTTILNEAKTALTLFTDQNIDAVMRNYN